MTIDTSTAEGREKRLDEIVRDYSTRGMWSRLVQLIGGSPRYDLQDLTDADAGEPPKGAVWQ